MKGPVSYDGALAEIEVQHWRKTKVDAVRAQLRSEHIASFLRELTGARRTGIPCSAKHPHGRQPRETFTKSLHATALVVDRDQQRRVAQGMNFGGQFLQLAWMFIVPREQDHSTSQRMTQALAGGFAELLAFDVQHDQSRRRWCVHWIIAPVRRLRMPFPFHVTSPDDDAQRRASRDSRATDHENRKTACLRHHWSR